MLRPAPSAETQRFWDGAREGVLLLRRCTACGRWHHPEARDCACGSVTLEWQPASGRATLVSHTTTRRANLPGLADEVPFTILLVRLEEGVQMVSGLPGEADGLRCGDHVAVWFDRLDDELTVPRFRPVRP